MNRIPQDVRYAARKLLRAPGFTIFAVATLAIAIGATTSVFSIIDAVLLRPLPFPEPGRLVFVESQSSAGKPLPVSPMDWMDYRSQSHSFTDLAAVEGGRSANLVRPEAGTPAVRVTEARVSATFFDVLRVQARLGRLFAPGEDQRTAARVAVLSDAGWRTWFGGDPHVVGRVVRLDGDPYTIVGVAPPEAVYPAETEVFVPAVWRDYEIGDNARGSRFISAVGRLRPAATTESARRDLDAIARRIAVAFPRHDAKIGAWLEPLQQQIVGDTRPALWATFGAVVFVLLIACFNVANLLLVRATGRFGEIAVRNALGASRGAVVRQLLTESMLLAIAAAGLGTLIASWIVSAVVAFGPRGLPRLGEVAVSGRVLAFTVVAAVITALAFGLAPALHAARSDISQMLRETTRGASHRAGDRMRSLLIVAEMALAVVLLTGFGLLLRSFDRLTRVNPGFDPQHLVAFSVALSGDRYEYEYHALSQSVAQPRFFTILLGAFAGIALLLAMTGMYGVIAYLASQRTREFGVRLALGATYGQVARLVFARGLPLAGAGLVLGVATAVVATRALGSMLYAVSPLDPVTFGAVVIALAVVAAVASLAPARRAARVDPVIAMRAE